LLSQDASIHAPDSIGFDEARLPMDWSREAVLVPLLRQLAELREANPQLLDGGWACEQVDDEAGRLVLKHKMGDNRDWLFVINLGDSTYRLPVEPKSRSMTLAGTQRAEFQKGELLLGTEQAAIIEVFRI